MQPTACSVIAKRRLTLHLSVFSLLMIALGLFAGCTTRDQSTQKRAEQGVASPSASPSPRPSPQPTFGLPPGETIIVIKDGSVDLEFDDAIFKQDPSNPNKYVAHNATLASPVTVTPTAAPSPTPTTCAVTPNSTIKLDAGGGTRDITIKGDGTAKTVEIVVDGGEYTACKPGRKHCNDLHPFKEVIIDGRRCRKCTPPEKCKADIRVSL
jgi:hypothetical protein